MACNSPLSGNGLPNISDPCICNAPKGSVYADTMNQKIYFRFGLSNPCQVSDWLELCSLCPVPDGANDITFDDSLIPCANPFGINGTTVEQIIHSIICRTPTILDINIPGNFVSLKSPDNTVIQIKPLPSPSVSTTASNVSFSAGGLTCANSYDILGPTLADVVNQIVCNLPLNISVNTLSGTITNSSQNGFYNNIQSLPQVTLTNNVNLTNTQPHQITLTTGGLGKILNIPAPVIAHRRRTFLIEGATAVPINGFTNTNNFNTIVIDTTGGVSTGGPNNSLIVPRSGYYFLQGRAAMPAMPIGVVHGIVLLVNGSFVHYVNYPSNGISSSNIEVNYTGNLTINDQVSMQLFSTSALNAQNLDLYLELKH